MNKFITAIVFSLLGIFIATAQIPASVEAAMKRDFETYEGGAQLMAAANTSNGQIFMVMGPTFNCAYSLTADGAVKIRGSEDGFPSNSWMIRDPKGADLLNKAFVQRAISEAGGIEKFQAAMNTEGQQYTTVIGAAYYLAAGVRHQPSAVVLDGQGQGNFLGTVAKFDDEIRQAADSIQ